MNSSIACVLSLLLCLPAGRLLAQEEAIQPGREVGRRFVQNYGPEVYGTIAQNWEVIQDQKGLIYVANGAGMLEYDGVRWRQIRLSNLGTALSLAVDKNNQIYVGGMAEIGYLAPDANGILDYHSLVSKLPDSLVNGSFILGIEVWGESVFFRSHTHIFQLNQTSLELEKVWPANGRIFHQLIGEDLVMWRQGIEWGKVSGDSLIPFGGGVENLETFPSIVPYPSDRENSDELLLVYESGRIDHFDGEQIKAFPLAKEATDYLSQKAVWEAFPLGEQGYFLLTVPLGGIFIDNNGELIDQLEKNNGLDNTLLYDVFMDKKDHLWLGTDYGVSRMELFSPFSIFAEEENLNGSVNSIIRHQGSLYVGTHEGLNRLLPTQNSAKISQFQEVRGIGACMAFYTDGLNLLAGGGNGLFQISGDKVENILPDIRIIYSLYASPFDPSIIYVGFSHGLGVLKKEGNRFVWKGTLEGITDEVRSLVETERGTLWIGTSVKGVLRFELPASSFELIDQAKPVQEIPGRLTTFGESEGIATGYVNVHLLDNHLVASTLKGLRQFDEETETFVPETAFGEQIADSNMFVFRIEEGANDRKNLLFDYKNQQVDTRNSIGALIRNPDHTYSLESFELNRIPIPSIAGMQVLYSDPLQEEIVWMGGTKGLIRYDLTKEKTLSESFPVYLRAVKTSMDSIVYYGNPLSEVTIELPYAENSLRFEFAAAFFQSEEHTHYQVFLEGNDKAWSPWTKETYSDYTNLGEGTYRFHIRARNVAFQISESEACTLVILPPWYRTWWAYLLYLITGAFVIGLLVRQYSKWKLRQLQEQNRELEQTVAERTVEIRETLDTLKTTQDQLIIQEKMASLGLMTAGIAHEIKNPLNFVQNFSEIANELASEFEEDLSTYLESNDPEDLNLLKGTIEDLKQNTELIHKHGMRATQIVDGMMDHAQDNDRQQLSVQLNSLITRTIPIAVQGYQAKEEGFEVKVEQDLAADLPLLELYPQEFQRVILNLINNACFAMEDRYRKSPEGYLPHLRVQTSREAAHVFIRIRDNGSGIPEAIHDQIFTPFFTSKPTGQGNVGLGLSISYDIITQGYQGRLSFESERESHTEFTIQLPLQIVADHSAKT